MASNRKGPSRFPPSEDVEAPAAAAAKATIKRKTSKATREEMQAAMRARSHSQGSTLGAFYHNDAPLPTGAAAATTTKKKAEASHDAAGAGGLRKRRSSKKHQQPPPLQHQQPPPFSSSSYQQPQPPTQIMAPTVPSNATGSDLGDVASLAIMGLGDDIDISELMGGAPPARKNSRRPPPQTAADVAAPAPPPATSKRIPRAGPSSSSMPTILDESEANHDDYQLGQGISIGNTPENSRKTLGGGKGAQSRASTDSLRVSDVSVDDVAGMLSSLDRDNSMFLSDVSGMEGFGFPSIRSSNLAGSSVLDKQSSGSMQHTHNRNLPPTAPSHTKAPSQQDEIASFAAMLHADYGAADTTSSAGPATNEAKSHPLKSQKPPRVPAAKDTEPYKSTTSSEDDVWAGEEVMTAEEEEIIEHRQSLFMDVLDPTHWLTKDVLFDESGTPYFDESRWTLAGLVRNLYYNPISPEFTSLQQFCWAVNLGIFMGFYTAFWKEIIEHSVDFMWEKLPHSLLEWGVFTELDGSFPMYHYMWMCQAFWGGLLSYIFAVLPTPIPGQNEWIQNVHTRGVQDSETFFHLFVLATLGMASGLSLGPELPLVLTSGMIGSRLGIQCKQSVLQARVMNITAASAAIGGFFGFPMAGALFVMEIPHRMGLQYFEALSPATIASIVAVLCNRLLTNNDVTGYYSYPFLTTSLPSEIFTSAIVFGLFGAFVGTVYAKGVLKLKDWVHDFFHAPHDDHHDAEPAENGPTEESAAEKTPLLNNENSARGYAVKEKKEPPAVPRAHQKMMAAVHKYIGCVIPYEPYRAGAAGVIAGGLVGVICMFVPHVTFWGEAQLQTLIDRGRTPLPVFGKEDEPTAALTALGYCMIDPTDAAAVREGFGIGCSFLITIAKIATTGLSLGTGIIGGHFWGPLFAGCAASHFFQGCVVLLAKKTGFGVTLAAYPCVTILCTMGAAHVVTFRAHTAIMLILTLTISTFDDNTNNGQSAAGDYSAVFPLLVISVFVSLMVSRQTVFYGQQRSRGDIMALPEVLCEPGKEGMPMVLDYEGQNEDYDEEDDYSDYTSEGEGEEAYVSDADIATAPSPKRQSPAPQPTQADIERDFDAKARAMAAPPVPDRPSRRELSSESASSRSRGTSPLPPRPQQGARLMGTISGGSSPRLQDRKRTDSGGELPPKMPAAAAAPESSGAAPAGLGQLSSSRLDELLAAPLENPGRPKAASHRRIQSAPNVDFGGGKKFHQRQRSGTLGKDDKSVGSGGGGGGGRHTRSDSIGSQASGKVMRIATFGHLSVEQPSLMDQARLRAASSVIVESRHIRHPSMPSKIPRGRHSRQHSASSIGAASGGPPLSVSVAVHGTGLPADEVERAYNTALNQQTAGNNRSADGSTRNFSQNSLSGSFGG